MLKGLKRMRRKYGAGFMAIVTVFFMLIGELVAFVSPQKAMAAEKSRKSDEYYTYITEETHSITTGNFINVDYDSSLYNTDKIAKDVQKTYIVYEHSNEPNNYTVNVPISLECTSGTSGGHWTFISTSINCDINSENDGKWVFGTNSSLNSDLIAGYSFDTDSHRDEYQNFVNGKPIDINFSITRMIKEDAVCYPAIWLKYNPTDGEPVKQCYSFKVEFKKDDGSTSAATVTVYAGTGGTATAGAASANKGDKVTLTATPDTGYDFDSWSVESGDVTIADASSASTSFTVKGTGSAIKIKANFAKAEPRIKTTSLPGATLNESYSAKIETVHINSPKFTATGLPDWLSIDGSTGKLTGTPTETGSYEFTVTVTGKSDIDDADVNLSQKYTVKVSEPSDDDDDHHEPASWVKNPNEKQGLVMTSAGVQLGNGITAGWQEQGEIAKAVFKASTPIGWTEAFSFNLLKDGKPAQSVKSGTISLYVPAAYKKAGRQYAILALGKNGVVYVLPDTDQNPNTITVSLTSFDGYALELIYKD